MTEQNQQFNQQFNTAQIDPADIAANKVVSGFAYFGILFFLPLVVSPESRYGRFHANQGLILLLFSIATSIVRLILRAILVSYTYDYYSYSSIHYGFGTYIFWALSAVLWLAVMALFIIGMINGFSGKVKELPIIGKLKLIK